jgi:hypothetical protein
LSPYPDQLLGEYARLGSGLLGLRWISLRAAGGLEDEVLGFGLERFEVLEVAFEFAGVGAD